MPARKYLKNVFGDVLISSDQRLSVYSLVEKLKSKTRNFNRIDLSNQVLPGISLRELLLVGAQFYHSQFQIANFSFSNLSDCQAMETDFEKAKIASSILNGGNFSKCNFDGVLFSGSDLRGANFSGSSFRNAVLENIIVDEDTDFSDCDLTGALVGVEVGEANFDFAKIDAATKSNILKLN
ncbi:MAG: pentapeptide repeat-containing protein [Bacteroidetes bacterium]|nr:pentapeptide repeat-containing protein [Bacteroidota bacterium]